MARVVTELHESQHRPDTATHRKYLSTTATDFVQCYNTVGWATGNQSNQSNIRLIKTLTNRKAVYNKLMQHSTIKKLVTVFIQHTDDKTIVS